MVYPTQYLCSIFFSFIFVINWCSIGIKLASRNETKLTTKEITLNSCRTKFKKFNANKAIRWHDYETYEGGTTKFLGCSP
jgi:hypothetical protein